MKQQIGGESFTQRFFDEILLNSGQYALFYILMNFSSDGLRYFTNFGHSILLLLLIVQTTFLALKGRSALYRFLGSLIVPASYSIIELREGIGFVLNMGHMFFWIFSILTGLLQVTAIGTEKTKWKAAPEFALTFVNVFIFIFVYFYFDLVLGYRRQLDAGAITNEIYRESLEINYFAYGFRDFLTDPAHIYVILGGLLLGTSISIGRWKIILLKDKINELFGTYVDRGVRDKIMTYNRTPSERKRMCVLFSDIRNFTAKSESSDPEKVTEMLNRYFTAWDETIARHKGIIDKFIGDAIMVIFDAGEDSAACDNAVRSALEMIQRLPGLDSEMRADGLPPVESIGVGIHLGEVVVGDIGSERRKNFTVIGDNVNIASRLEAYSKSTQSKIIVSEDVYAALSGELKLKFRALGAAKLRGKSEATRVYGDV